MKNKYQKLHRIVIGKSGSGKSFSILSGVKEDNKINVICYPEVIGAHLDVYEKAFPKIFLKYRQEAVSTVSTMPPHITNWKPSIHMPKEAARIWLKVTDVRVERLQEITRLSVQKEGIEVDPKECAGKFDFITELFLLFQELWDSTIKKSDLDSYGWDANPYVWVIEFERCEKPKEEKGNDSGDSK